MRGYIAMLATRSEYRGQGIAGKLVRMAVDKMIEKDADEVRTPNFHASKITNEAFRSPSKPKSTTFPPCESTKTWASSARNDYIATISTATPRIDCCCISSLAFRS